MRWLLSRVSPQASKKLPKVRLKMVPHERTLRLTLMLIEMRREGAIRICLDFINLNRATPKNEYPMPIIDLLINSASGNKVISFLDGNAGYNQIFMAKEDINKTVFRCLGFVGLFEGVVMVLA
jgi:hypothetical protein